jgi:hypothetical protein
MGCFGSIDTASTPPATLLLGHAGGVGGFLKACPAKPLPSDDIETALCWNMAVPAQIRANLAAREIHCDDVLRGLQLPVLVTRGSTASSPSSPDEYAPDPRPR